MLGELEATCAKVVFLGVQPAGTEFFDPVSPRMLAAVEHVYQCLADGADFTQYPFESRVGAQTERIETTMSIVKEDLAAVSPDALAQFRPRPRTSL